MSNAWFRDPRTKEGEAKAFDAERAERRGNVAIARDLYREAAEAFQVVALNVPADHPNTRSDLAIAAVATFARAGDFGHAVDLAGMMLAQIDALSPYGRSELSRMRADYASVLASMATKLVPDVSTRKPTLRAAGPGNQLRERVRGQFPFGRGRAA